MAEKAHITSIEALENFRNSLVIYLTKARPTVEEVSADVLRVKLWLQNDQRMNLEGLVRRRARELEQAQQALFSARVSTLRQEKSAEQLAVQRAKRALDDAEAKLRRLKHWNREFDSRVEPLVKQLEKLHSVLTIDFAKATHQLTQDVNNLLAYADIAPTGSATSPLPQTNPAGGDSNAGSPGGDSTPQTNAGGGQP